MFMELDMSNRTTIASSGSRLIKYRLSLLGRLAPRSPPPDRRDSRCCSHPEVQGGRGPFRSRAFYSFMREFWVNLLGVNGTLGSQKWKPARGLVESFVELEIEIGVCRERASYLKRAPGQLCSLSSCSLVSRRFRFGRTTRFSQNRV